MNNRNSNHELLRIISMLFIIIGHIIIHGELLGKVPANIQVYVELLLYFIIVHVNLFVLLTGYYQVDKDFNNKKVVNLYLHIFFYSLFFALIFIALGQLSINFQTAKVMLLPLTSQTWWFASVYFVLYLLSPFINRMIKNINKKEYERLLLILFIVFSLVPMISSLSSINVGKGYSLLSFVFMYLLGGYLKLYPMKKNISNHRYVFIFVIAIILNFILNIFATKYTGSNSLLVFIASRIGINKLAYSNPLIIIAAVSFFQIFTKLNFKSKYINVIASLTFGIYLIHEHPLIRERLYNLILTKNIINSPFIVIYIIGFAIAIFMICGLIEYLRRKIFDLFRKKTT